MATSAVVEAVVVTKAEACSASLLMAVAVVEVIGALIQTSTTTLMMVMTLRGSQRKVSWRGNLPTLHSPRSARLDHPRMMPRK